MKYKDEAVPIFCCVCGNRIGWGIDIDALRLFCDECVEKEVEINE